jgi:formylglycine-generating enzyme required for sulfatase activity
VPALPPAAAPGAEAAQAWAVVEHASSLAAIDEFIRRYGNVPILGDLARKRQEDLAKQAAVPVPQPQPGPQVAMDTPALLTGIAPLTPAQERGLKPKDTFRECSDCPEMVVVPAGSFTMGSPAGAKDRSETEGPQHTLTIGRPFAVGKFHVTRDQFAAFLNETGYAASTTCWKWAAGRHGSWRDPGFAQEGSHPAVCMSWDDAKAYVGWIAKKTGKQYRLLTESEFEYAARGQMQPGTYPRFWFGNDETDLCRNANGVDRKARDSITGASSWTTAPCNDGYAYTSPVGHYQPNAFGLYDMAGNAYQWMEDCWNSSYSSAPADGSARTTGGCSSGRVVRGGAWSSFPTKLRAAARLSVAVESYDVGFRVAKTLAP